LLLSLLLLSCACNTADADATDSATDAKETETPTDAPTEKPTEKESEMNTEKQEMPTSLKIGSYNIANGRNVDHDISILGKDIKDQGLDIVGLQEIDQYVNRSGSQNTMRKLSKASGLEYYVFFKAINLDGGEYGLGILSRYPIVSSEATKLYSGSEEQRVLGHAVIDVVGKEVNFFVTHMSYESQTLWDKQFEEISVILKECGGYILTGDFNVTNLLPFYNELDGAEIVNYGADALPTFEDGTTIDNIIYSKDFWSFEEPQTLPNGHSDHYLLFATAEWQ
jgi:endonuclease/exonuclease/phosphatase family metal-dependent hydrolase